MEYETANTTLSFYVALLVGTLTEIEYMRYLKWYTRDITFRKGAISVKNIFTFFFLSRNCVSIIVIFKKSHTLHRAYISILGL